MTADHRTQPLVLGFRDRKEGGRLPVNGPDGQPVAFIATKPLSSNFEVTGADGIPLCTGSARFAGLSGHREDRAPSGAVLVSFASRWRTDVATLADGRSFSITGKWLGADWQAIAEDGSVGLSSVKGPGAGMFHPDDWLVAVNDATLDLAEVVAIVELHRLVVQRHRAAAHST